MADLGLTRRAPLETISIEAPDSLVSARLGAPVGRIAFRGAMDAAKLCENAFGVSLPIEINRASATAELAALCLGPDEWLLLFPETDFERVLQRLKAALLGTPHSLVDVSRRQTAIEIHGRNSAPLLNSCVMLDLAVEAFPVNTATRTLFAKAEIILWRTAVDSFHIEAWRSFIPYVAGLLSEASLCLPHPKLS